MNFESDGIGIPFYRCQKFRKAEELAILMILCMLSVYTHNSIEKGFT